MSKFPYARQRSFIVLASVLSIRSAIVKSVRSGRGRKVALAFVGPLSMNFALTSAFPGSPFGSADRTLLKSVTVRSQS